MPALRERASSKSFERECERLRPLGEAYVLRRFSGQLGRADAEDAVSEVLIRIHRQATGGRLPQNLRAAFFTGVRNAATDLLRSRAARRTVALEAALDVAAEESTPPERAEAHEDSVRLQEALARMKPNYRETIILRFGLALTVPELARHFEISLPAAKRLVARATRQVRKRAAAVDGAEYCPEMRRLARRSLLDRHASATAEDAESDILRKHFEHCGTCKSFIANVHYGLHEFAGGALIAAGTGDQLTGKATVADRAFGWVAQAADGAHTVAEKARLAAFKHSGGLHGADAGAAGAFAGSGQKLAALCATGAAAATCVGVGVVGPGVAVDLVKPDEKPAIQRPADLPSPAASQASEQPASTRPSVDAQVAPPLKPAQRTNAELGLGQTTSSGGSPPTTRDFAAPVGGNGGGGGGGSGGGGGGFGFER